MKKVFNGTVSLTRDKRLVIVLPPCWDYIAKKLSQDIEKFCFKYRRKDIVDMSPTELEEKWEFDIKWDLLVDLYSPFFSAVRRAKAPRKSRFSNGKGGVVWTK